MALSSDQKVLSPRESGTFIVRVAQDVSIDMEGIKKCASEVLSNTVITHVHFAYTLNQLPRIMFMNYIYYKREREKVYSSNKF